MRVRAVLGLAACSLFIVAAGGDGCSERPPEQRNVQAEAARDAANSVRFSGNGEIANIKRRLEMTSDPTLMGYIVLLNEAGQPILYEGVLGKVTSGGKRLTPVNQVVRRDAGGTAYSNVVVAAPSDEGTHGSSNPFVYYWNSDGVYRQWSGHYLYSSQPIRLRAEPLVISVSAPPPPPADQARRTAPPSTAPEAAAPPVPVR